MMGNIDEVQEYIMSLPGVIGAGVGKEGEGIVIIAYVEGDHVLRDLPTNVRGIPIIPEVAGEFGTHDEYIESLIIIPPGWKVIDHVVGPKIPKSYDGEIVGVILNKPYSETKNYHLWCCGLFPRSGIDLTVVFGELGERSVSLTGGVRIHEGEEGLPGYSLKPVRELSSDGGIYFFNGTGFIFDVDIAGVYRLRREK